MKHLSTIRQNVLGENPKYQIHVVQVWACVLTCKGWIGLLDLWETGEERESTSAVCQWFGTFCAFIWFDFDNLLVESLHQKKCQQMLDLRSKSSLASACEHVIKYSKNPASHSLRLLIHQNNQILFCRGIFLGRLRGFAAFHHRNVLKCNIRKTERWHSEVRPLQSGDKVKCQLYIR